tara:strand:- start:235 stop:918 length:684 start_codon:yes stop_codon:yes gene_type:complete
MKKILLSITIYLIFFTNLQAHTDHYSSVTELKYELFRNNKLIGYHNYNFERNSELLKVKSDVKFKITKMGVDLYKYEAISEEIYNKNQLIKFESKTNQNKKQKYVNIDFNRSEDKLLIDGSSFKGDGSKDFVVGTWWNHEMVKAKAQISAISGRIIEQKVTFLGKVNLNINGKDYKALHFNFASSDETLPKEKKLNTDIWYDEDTKIWLKASFNKTGHWEYRLKNFK